MMYEEYEDYIKKWKRYIYSNKGLFEIKLNNPNKIIGPKLSKTVMIGDSLTLEITLFSRYATEEQVKFNDYLAERDVVKSRQYMMVIIGSERVWKEDVKILIEFLDKISESTLLIKKEMEDLEDDVERMARIKQMLGSIIDQNELNEILSNFEDFISKLRVQESKLNSLRLLIANNIENLKENFPFLF